MASHRCELSMYQNLYLHGRYDINEGPAVHKSATSLVVFANDHHVDEEQVVSVIVIALIFFSQL